MKWRGADIPVPEQLSGLPRTAEGIPVTYTVAWSSESRLFVAPEPLLGGTPALFHRGSQGKGMPLVGFGSVVRIREATLKGLCQVCACKLPPLRKKSRWVCDLRGGASTLRLDQEVPLLIDSWTCDDCIGYALRACPALTRKRSLKVFAVKEAVLVPTPERPKHLKGPPAYGPVGLVKIAAADYDEVTARELLELSA